MGRDAVFTVKFPGLLSAACMQGAGLGTRDERVAVSGQGDQAQPGEAGTGQIQRELSQKPWQVADELDGREE